MIIQMERSGGFAAIPLRAAVDTAALEQEEENVLRRLLETAAFFDLPERIQGKGGGADRFQYRLTIQDKARSHTVEVGEESAPPELQELIRHVTQLARRQRS